MLLISPIVGKLVVSGVVYTQQPRMLRDQPGWLDGSGYQR